MLDEALWVTGMSCGIIAHRADKLEDYFQIVKLAFENFPQNLLPRTKSDTKYKYHFTHMYNGMPLNSSIYVDTDIRGGTVQWLHITESAYIKDRQKLKTGSKQAVPKTGRITEETTGNGMNEFYDEYMESRSMMLAGKTSDMDYMTFFYSWVENPEYTLHGEIPAEEKTAREHEIIKIGKEQFNIDVTDGQLLWRRWKMRELTNKQVGIGLSTEQLFKQEYPLTVQEAFQSGAGSVFSLEKIEQMQPKPILKEPEIRAQWAELQLLNADFYSNEKLEKVIALVKLGVWFWHLPKPHADYVGGVDPADGQGADYTPANFWTRKPDEVSGKVQQVAQFYGKVLPDELAGITVEIAKLYNTAFLGVENNMIATVLFVSKIYDNIFYKVKIDEKVKKRTKILGWNTNMQTREKMIDDYEIHFRDDLLEVNSPVSISEMRTFIRKQQPSGAFKREHADGKHDDSLFGDFIAIQMTLYRKPEAKVLGEKPTGW